MVDLRERLKYLIDMKGITAYQVSKETGVSESTISHVMTGKTQKMKIDTFKILAEYFGVSRQWLQTGLGEMRPTNTQNEVSSHPNSDCNNPEHKKLIQELTELKVKFSYLEKLYENAIGARKEHPPEKHAQGGLEEGSRRKAQ